MYSYVIRCVFICKYINCNAYAFIFKRYVNYKYSWCLNIKRQMQINLSNLKQLFFRNYKLKKHFKFLKIFKYLNKFEIS